MLKILYVLVLSILSTSAFAYVKCENVEVTAVQSAAGASFHSFHELGIQGSTVFVSIPPSICSDSEGEAMAATVYLVLSDYDNAGPWKKMLSSMLLTAKASGKQVSVHATNRGVNSRGFQVIDPYYMVIKD